MTTVTCNGNPFHLATRGTNRTGLGKKIGRLPQQWKMAAEGVQIAQVRLRLTGRTELNLVVAIVDGDHGLTKKKAIRHGTCLGGHGKAVHVGV